MMRRLLLGGLLLLLVVSLITVRDGAAQNPPSQAPAKQQAPPRPPIDADIPTLPVSVELVNMDFSVMNRRSKFITDLTKEDFQVFEDGKPQDIRYFSRESDLPLRIGLLLDTSNSIRDRLKFEQEAAIDFLGNVVRRNKDLAFLMTFDSEPQLIMDYTHDVSSMAQAIQKLRAGGATALYDAIYVAALQHLQRAPLPAGDNPAVRRVLVVISDGEDVLSDRTRTEAIEMAQRSEVTIYAISSNTNVMEFSGSGTTREKAHLGPSDKILQMIAEETGGRSFFPYKIDDLAQSFQDIGTELRNQYSLAYTPSNRTLDGRFRKVRIEPKQKGLVVRSRKGYYAPRPKAAARPADQ